ncbi:MAG: DUF6586 family protein [Pseudomonadales bacterium]
MSSQLAARRVNQRLMFASQQLQLATQEGSNPFQAEGLRASVIWHMEGAYRALLAEIIRDPHIAHQLAEDLEPYSAVALMEVFDDFPPAAIIHCAELEAGDTWLFGLQQACSYVQGTRAPPAAPVRAGMIASAVQSEMPDQQQCRSWYEALVDLVDQLREQQIEY